LSTQGRIVAAGLSVAVGSALVGFMAAGDHTANATQSNSSSSSSSATSGSTNDGGSATPYGGQSYDAGGRSGNSSFPQQAQPQTRTGGS
jgi:hypothetical protein